ncbi:MAG TPA: VCBS repeat-containing protein [Chitinophagaceae bacterium]|nr:VCBS repeat-containing protein [Chitinophagaceae bacterium]
MKKWTAWLVIIFACSLVINILYACKESSRNKSHASVPDVNIREGKRLAEKYCQSCHLLPDPSQLDARSWERGVLPHMGPYLGIFAFGFERYPSGRRDPNLPNDFYPKKPVVQSQEWQYIIDYYTSLSPDTLPGQSRDQEISMDLALFQVETPRLKIPSPALSLVKISGEKIIGGDFSTQRLYSFDKGLRQTDSFAFAGTVVGLERQLNRQLVCNIGNINPNNGSSGSLQSIVMPGNKSTSNASLIVDSLKRPVDFVVADVNKDGRDDYVICEFGFTIGQLSWVENTGTGYKKHIIKALPGAARVITDDYNRDGLADLWVLFAQGNEGIFLFTNEGEGRFREQQVLKFPPVYGSTHFELIDFNKDGFKDIVYACGDNADFSRVLKNYHGIYIFVNDGQNTFSQKFFFPINGCYKSISKDFDNDGDLDIATISFFADYINQPEEGFVYLENKGDFKFAPFSVEATQRGHWLTMDAGDVDGDSRIDIVLGNFTYGPSMFPSAYNWKNGPPFMLLRNIGNKKRE